ncbi:type I-B CRISPR-associated protein Cas5b [Halanaeroarchaeum sulfurireducens]|uniref:CRISPR-associated protein Cas5 n=1 Tax=Halanaeroarchaeum sulfurireducens TaxID=1604004 RepID=A0A0F7PCI9_9EURY|nr:type I-B CRISPR-associated protein Cas5b [Halanaeroarchaeum sulfurireducens]AKH97359.1 CRISPR-associated protein Cas5 [Halanaeroarchaeum sulfurireducens]ALG81761.1 CRISPR-associated protein Cas5 [Halanaeroarchaeum sulfurireducens]
MSATSDASSSDESEARPERCLSLTVSGPWGHFRRVEGNVVKQTYRIVPRTTVAGLLAAILGIGRDEYYDLFGPDSSWIAIEPAQELRTVNMPMNTLSTAEGDLTSLNAHGKISIKLPNPEKPRQQHNYEVLVEPAYRIDVALADRERYEQLREMLATGKSYYVPSLGLSEHLAEIDYHGEFDVKTANVPDEGGIDVDSTVPGGFEDVIMDTERRCQVEESPAYMERNESGRKTTAFATYAFNPDSGPLAVTDATASTVGDRTVVFL